MIVKPAPYQGDEREASTLTFALVWECKITLVDINRQENLGYDGIRASKAVTRGAGSQFVLLR